MNKSILKFTFASAMVFAGFGFMSQTVFAEELEPETIIEETITDESEEIVEEEIFEEPIEVQDDQQMDAGMANPSDTDLNIEAHVANIGWMPEVHEEDLIGTTGQANGLEALIINLDSTYAGDVHYQAHVANVGWQNPVDGGQMSGTEGKALSIEAIRIWLTGEVSEKYDIYYQSHVANIGWLGWAHNGQNAGSQGKGLQMEALQIQLVKKGNAGPTNGMTPFYVEQLQVQAHVANVGWMDPVSEQNMIGTTGNGNAIEGIKISLATPVYEGKVLYRTYVENDGWQSVKTGNVLSGTQGESKHIEAIQMSLDGEIKNHFDIYYQAHVSNLGWMGRAKNGESAGSIGYGYGIEAIMIQLIEKGLPTPVSSKAAFDQQPLSYNTHVSNVGWTSSVDDAETSGNLYNSIEAIRIAFNKELYPSGHIEYRSHIAQIGWENEWAQDGGVSGTTGRSLALEGIQIRLSGDISKEYNVFYRTYTSGYGWLDWASNGNFAGTQGLSRSILGIQISLVPIGTEMPATGSDVSFVTNSFGQKNGENVTGYVHVDSGNKKIYIKEAFDPTWGIDISAHNGYIDLSSYLDQFVIIRVTYGTNLDYMAKRNMDLCEKLGIPYGVYCYSYALDNAGALSEAEFLLEQIKGRNIQVGVWFDMEDADNYKLNRGALTPTNCSTFCKTFCSKIREAGYFTGIYSSESWFNYYIRGCDEFDKWVAHWGIDDGNLGYRTDYLGPIQQYTSVPLDRNIMYVPLNYFKV